MANDLFGGLGGGLGGLMKGLSTLMPQDDPAVKMLNAQSEVSSLGALKSEQEAIEKAKQDAIAEVTCPSCGFQNPEGTRFCQECGSKVGAAAKKFCVECGAQLAPGTRFCGECGAKQEV